jgi:Uma2 family endonuclease
LGARSIIDAIKPNVRRCRSMICSGAQHYAGRRQRTAAQRYALYQRRAPKRRVAVREAHSLTGHAASPVALTVTTYAHYPALARSDRDWARGAAHMAQATATYTPRRRRFTVDEYHRMAKAGILHEDDRIELIEGDLIEMGVIGSRHMACVIDLNRRFILGLGDRAIVSIQNPVRLSSRSEPEPDVVLLRPRTDGYREALPGPEDVLLLIEVADSTLGYLRDTKLALYAAAGIPEVWIWDLKRRRVLLHRDPAGRSYRTVEVVERGEIAPAVFPDLLIPVAEILA